jgi:hypothetical protein
MLPARPPASSANPRKRKRRARQARLSKPPSIPARLCLSSRLTMIMPSVAKRPGSQSLNRTATGNGMGTSWLLARAERMAAEKKNHQPVAKRAPER